MLHCQLSWEYLESGNASIHNSKYINLYSLIYNIFVKYFFFLKKWYLREWALGSSYLMFKIYFQHWWLQP